MSSTQPDPRCFTRVGATDKQEIHHFNALPQLAISAIHDILLQSSVDKDGFHTQPRDAAAFRCTCKAFNDAVIMPQDLKLAFTEPPSLVTCQSLTAMISKPRAARTQLSLRLCMQLTKQPHRQQPQTTALGCEECQPWAYPLSALPSTKVQRLEMPSFYINATIAAACKALPGLQELVLHVSEVSEMGMAAPSSGSEFSDEDEDEDAAFARAMEWQRASQLRSLTLSVPPGQPPFVFCTMEPPLDLSEVSSFQRLRLVGPIVRADDELEFDDHIWVPPCTKVTIDPGLKGRKPTRWARPVTEYERADELPPNALLPYSEYNDEDQQERSQRMQDFVDKVCDTPIDDKGRTLSSYDHDAFASGYLCEAALEGYLSAIDEVGRSNMLHAFDRKLIAQDVFSAAEEWMREEMSKFGGCCCEFCSGFF